MRSNQKKWITLAAVLLAVSAVIFFWKKPGGDGSPHAGHSPHLLPEPRSAQNAQEQEEGATPDSPPSVAQQPGAQDSLTPEGTSPAPGTASAPQGEGAVVDNSAANTAGQQPQKTEGNAALPAPALIPPAGQPATAGTKPSSPSAQAQMPAAPAAQTDACYTLSYKHQDLPGHQSGEACTQHKNLLALPGQKLSAKSLCVRVNGTPVKFAFDSKKNHVLLSSIAGPRSEITVRYCTGGATCAEDCTVPRDEFMEALGAVDTSGSQPTVAWDIRNSQKGPTKEEAALDKELVELKRELASVERNSEEIFKGWVAGKEKAVTCKATPGKVAKL